MSNITGFGMWDFQTEVLPCRMVKTKCHITKLQITNILSNTIVSAPQSL